MVQRDSSLVSTWKYGESGAPGEGVEAPGPFPIPGPMHLSHLGVSELHPFILNQ